VSLLRDGKAAGRTERLGEMTDGDDGHGADLGREVQRLGEVVPAEDRQRGQGRAQPEGVGRQQQVLDRGKREESRVSAKVSLVSPATTMSTGALATPPMAP